MLEGARLLLYSVRSACKAKRLSKSCQYGYSIIACYSAAATAQGRDFRPISDICGESQQNG